jgi:hypothetical protein
MTRPSFSLAWAASQRIYDAADSGKKVAEVIGGYVAKNINNPNPEQRWDNTCAVRMSYILNQSGLIIPRIPAQTVSGADQRQYFFRVKNLMSFLVQQWGKADIVKSSPKVGDALLGKKGVILFQVSCWGDAQGHATLYNGSMCYDHCYFNEPGANYHTDRANFWSLP